MDARCVNQPSIPGIAPLEPDNRPASLDLEATIRNRPGRFVLFGELALRARLSKDWLVEGLLGAGEASAFYGAPGDSKSVLVEDLGLHVAVNTYRPTLWCGRKVRGGGVLYIALERKELVKRRALAFQMEHDTPDIPFAIVGDAGVDFRDANICNRILEMVEAVEAITRCPTDLIIIDTLSRALCGADENSSKDMGAVVRATSILQNDGARHVMWVHHVPHGGDRLRGHGSLIGAVDTAVHVTHDQGSDIRRATVTKANDSEEGEQVTFTLRSVTINPDDNTAAPVVVPVTDAPAKPKAAKSVRASTKLAIDIIRELAHETIRPWNDGPQVQAADVEAVRKEFDRRYVGKPAAKRQAWKRAMNDRQFIGQRDGKCWII
jgi:AAA domain